MSYILHFVHKIEKYNSFTALNKSVTVPTTQTMNRNVTPNTNVKQQNTALNKSVTVPTTQTMNRNVTPNTTVKQQKQRDNGSWFFCDDDYVPVWINCCRSEEEYNCCNGCSCCDGEGCDCNCNCDD
jgi:hypothetical protein